MKTKDISSLLSGADDETVSRLSEGRVMTDDERKRVYIMSKKKLNEMKKGFMNVGDEVSGVERDTRPAWRRYAGFAAALVVGIGVLGGSGMYILSRHAGNGASQGMLVEDEAIEASEPETEAESEAEPTEGEADSIADAADPNDSMISDEQWAANQLTYRSLDFISSIYGYGLEVDKTAPVVYDFDGYQVTFYPVVDDRYHSWKDVEAVAGGIYGEELAESMVNSLCKDISEADIEGGRMFYRTGDYENGNDTWYVRSELTDNYDKKVAYLDDEPVITVNDDGTVTAYRQVESQTLDEVVYNNEFTLAKSESDGLWRIIDIKDTLVENAE